MKIKTGLIALLMLSCILPPSATAFSLKRIWRVMNDIKTLEQQTLPNLNDIKNSNEASLNKLQAIEGNLEGNFGYGHLQNTTQDVNQRLWSNDKWIAVLAKSQSANNTAFIQAQENYERLYGTKAPSEIRTSLHEDDLTKKYYGQMRSISRAALATSQVSYDNINAHIRALHDMLAQLEAQPSAKAALDLNARLVAELGFIQLEMLKQQAVQTQILATHSQNDVNGLSDESKFLKWDYPS